jgi:UDP-N-acetylglucosamine--N-acetylmuramyl-(pentapeptide) pyrophosphoryl-undecaprenol N-acetylglucosamine transferase
LSEGSSKFRVVIAGGGTGGHLFPGIAVVEELHRRFKDPEILFIVGRRKMESSILADYGYRVTSIDVEGLKGRDWRKALRTLFKLPKSFWQSAAVIKHFAPKLVLGVGGYSSGPFCLAARLLGVPTAIHEQNSFPGLTNRLLARFVDRVLISFQESSEHFGSGRLFLTGNPVREAFFTDSGRGAKNREAFTLLVVGGSQGARAINQAFAEAIKILDGRGKHPAVIHQTGESDYERVREDYRTKGIQGEIVPFIQNMASAYDSADAVVGRAGATTIFELAAAGKPSILIPYPHAANQHQDTNAQAMLAVGGAEIIRQESLSGESLSQALLALMDNRERLRMMGENARRMARPDAARAIVDALVEMITRK